MVNSGLEGVIAAATTLSLVDGERGELVIAGYPVEALAGHATFRAALAAERALPPATVALLRECARAGADPMDALRIAAGTISLVSSDAVAIVARVPVSVAACWRPGRGEAPIAPRADLAHAAN